MQSGPNIINTSNNIIIIDSLFLIQNIQQFWSIWKCLKDLTNGMITDFTLMGVYNASDNAL